MELKFVIGPTCAGKSTWIAQRMERSEVQVAAVYVGRTLRARYGERTFGGEGAPEWAQGEAEAVMAQGVDEARQDGAQTCYVDGMPRVTGQIGTLIGRYPGAEYVVVTASYDVRMRRAMARPKGASRDLAMARLSGDYENCFNVLAGLVALKQPIRVVDLTDCGC